MKNKLSSFFVAALAIVALCAFLAPRETLNVLAPLAAVSLVVFVAANTSRLSRRKALVPAINTNPANWGTHWGGKKTFLSSAAIATRYALVKRGADSEHAAIVAAAADEPLGISNDQPAAAELEFTVFLLGPGAETVPVVAGGAIPADATDLYSKGDGTVIVKPTAAGTYWRVGSLVHQGAAAASGEIVVMVPQKPRKLIVIAALGNANGAIAALTSSATTTQSEFNALRDAAETLADDVRSIAAALNGDADVALATT
jgi:hypothetical protein